MNLFSENSHSYTTYTKNLNIIHFTNME